MNVLPRGWLRVPLAEAATKIGSGATPKGGHAAYATSGTPLIRSQNVHFSGFSAAGLAYLDDLQAKKLDGVIVRENDVLLNITGASIGRVTVAPQRMEGARVNQHVAIIRPVTGVEPGFLSKYLASPLMQRFIVAENYGVTRQALTKAMIEQIDLPVPPLPEQRRIVAKIDSLTAKSRRAREHLAHLPRLVEKYKQAVLAAAFRGDLTREWRSKRSAPTEVSLRETLLKSRASAEKAGKTNPLSFDFSPEGDLPLLPASWTWMPVAALATKVVDGVHKKPNYVERGVPFLTVRNLTAGGGIDFEGCRFVSAEDHSAFIKRTEPEEGDILITKDGTLGVVRAVRTSEAFSIFVSLALVKPVDRAMTDFLELALTSPIVQQQMTGVGSGLQHIHLTDLRKDMIPVAPEDERREIVRRVRLALAWIDRLASEATSARKLVDHLDQAVLAKAFRGELVPQDPADEPASVLLERIRAERDGTPKARRGRRAGSSTSGTRGV